MQRIRYVCVCVCPSFYLCVCEWNIFERAPRQSKSTQVIFERPLSGNDARTEVTCHARRKIGGGDMIKKEIRKVQQYDQHQHRHCLRALTSAGPTNVWTKLVRLRARQGRYGRVTMHRHARTDALTIFHKLNPGGQSTYAASSS